MPTACANLLDAVEAAMRAVTYIMDDDLEGAEAGLANGTSTFHKVRLSHNPCCLVSRLIGLEEKNAG